MKKCPPGVICIENITLFLLIIIIGLLCFFIYSNSKTTNITIKEKEPMEKGFLKGWIPSWPYNNLQNDVLLNPYAAPLSDERYLVPELVPINDVRGIPVNISTNIGATPYNTEYRQMGIITPLNGSSKDNILPLMGRPLFTNRDKWQYYTISNQHNNVKLPISFKGRSALNDYGVDQIFSGDTIYVEGYNDAFQTTIYENDTIRYLPFV
uniref:Uncharacterized protein n=1 Tax=viral metagenome TaxID=1070528 RepID=A0A6C0KPI3_9ZZZZ